MFRFIDDYAVIGVRHSAALLSREAPRDTESGDVSLIDCVALSNLKKTGQQHHVELHAPHQ